MSTPAPPKPWERPPSVASASSSLSRTTGVGGGGAGTPTTPTTHSNGSMSNNRVPQNIMSSIPSPSVIPAHDITASIHTPVSLPASHPSSSSSSSSTASAGNGGSGYGLPLPPPSSSSLAAATPYTYASQPSSSTTTSYQALPTYPSSSSFGLVGYNNNNNNNASYPVGASPFPPSSIYPQHQQQPFTAGGGYFPMTSPYLGGFGLGAGAGGGGGGGLFPSMMDPSTMMMMQPSSVPSSSSLPHLAWLHQLQYTVATVGTLVEILGMNADTVQRAILAGLGLLERLGQASGEIVGFVRAHPPCDAEGRPLMSEDDWLLMRRRQMTRWAMGGTALSVGVYAARFLFSLRRERGSRREGSGVDASSSSSSSNLHMQSGGAVWKLFTILAFLVGLKIGRDRAR